MPPLCMTCLILRPTFRRHPCHTLCRSVATLVRKLLHNYAPFMVSDMRMMSFAGTTNSPPSLPARSRTYCSSAMLQRLRPPQKQRRFNVEAAIRGSGAQAAPDKLRSMSNVVDAALREAQRFFLFSSLF